MDLVYQFTSAWENFQQNLSTTGNRLAFTAAVIIAGRIAFSLSKSLTTKKLSEKFRFDETILSVVRLVLQYGIIIICAVMVLDMLGVNTTGILTIIGTAGIAIGFALRDTMSNIAAGIVIIFLRPFKIGDFIEFGPTMGTVAEIGLFATKLNTPDGVCITSPNAAIWDSALKNFSNNPIRRMDIAVTILYTDSIDRAVEVLTEITKQSCFLTDPEPMVIVHSFGEAGININMRAWVHSDQYWDLYWPTFKMVVERVKEAGLTIALPRREVHVIMDKNTRLPE